MNKFLTMLKKPLRFVLCLLPISIVAGIFAAFYQLDLYSEQMLADIFAQVGSTRVFVAVYTAQSVVYTLFCGFLGYILSDKLGLWKSTKLEKNKIITTLIVSVVGGILLILDYWTFGNIIDGIKSTTAAGMTVSGIIASVLYGGVTEEVMMRLFFMSLIAFIIWKVFCRKYDRDHIPSSVFIAANILAAVAFAAGHLQANIGIFGQLTPLIVFRCFLMNGGYGLIFGRLYRKYGLIYSVIAHAVCHIVSKLIFLLFI